MSRRNVPFIFFEIPGRLPGLNEIIGAARTHYHASASQKKKAGLQCEKAIKAAGLEDVRVNGPARVEVTWFEPNKRRDFDNICAGTKFALDALVNLGILEDDDQNNIVNIEHHVLVDKLNPRVAMWVKECK